MSSGIMKKVQTAKYTKFLFQAVKNVAKTVFSSVVCYAIVPNCKTETLQENIYGGYIILKYFYICIYL